MRVVVEKKNLFSIELRRLRLLITYWLGYSASFDSIIFQVIRNTEQVVLFSPVRQDPPCKENMSKKNSTGKKTWLHQPSLLVEGHVVYQVKLLGNVTVESAKGADLVKEAIRKVKFNLQLQKARGEKPQKVELTISMTAIGIQEKQNKISLHSFPLQHISYCADDKSDKKICAFIARNDVSKTHECFVLESEKAQAEDITLTVGQAFDIAYQKYKENLNKDPSEAIKKLQKYQEKIKSLETENKNLRARVAELEEKLGIISTVDKVNEKNKERTESVSSNNSQPAVFQLESFGGTSSTDPVVDEEFFSNIFGPPLEGIVAVNGTANQSHDSIQPNSNGVAVDDTFESPQPQVKVEIVSDSVGTPVLAPPPRPARQKRRQPPPSLFEVTPANNNEVKSTSSISATVPSVVSSNPFQDNGDWTLTQPTQSTQPSQLIQAPQPFQPTQSSPFGDLLFDTQPKASTGLSFDDLDPLAGL